MVKMKNKSTLYFLNRMTLRTLRKSWTQFLAVILIGTIAVTLFVGLLSNADVFETQVNTAYNEGNLADLWVTTKNYDPDDYDEIQSFLGPEETIDSRFYMPCQIPGHTIYLAVSKEEPSISKPYGNLDKMNSDDNGMFFYLDKEMKSDNTMEALGKFQLGQEISYTFNLSSYAGEELKKLDEFVLPGKSNVLNGDTVSLTSKLTGFMSYPENITKSAYNSSVALISDRAFKKAFQNLLDENYDKSIHFFIYDALKKSLGFSSIFNDTLTNPNQYLIKAHNEDRISILKRNIQSYFNSKDVNNLIIITEKKDMPFYVTLNNDVIQARQFTFVFPFIFFAVAILVILTTLSQMILKERSQIGTMKAIGLSNKDIVWHYISISMFMVFIGILLGEIIGPILIPKILGQKYLLLYSLPKMKYQFPLFAGILTAVVFLLITVFVTILVLHNELKLKPVESMRPKALKMNFKPFMVGKKQKISMLSFRMGLRNIKANKTKSIMVLVGVMGCTALLVCGFGINDTVSYGIQHDLDLYKNADISVTFNNGRSQDTVFNDFRLISGIDKMELSITSKTNLYKNSGPQTSSNIYIIPQESEFIKLNFSKDEVAISQKISRVINAKEGDSITFQYNNVSYTAKIGLVYDAFIYHGIMVHQNSAFFRDIQDSFLYISASIRLQKDAKPDQVAEQIKQISYVSSASTKKEWEKSIDSALSSIQLMTNAVKVFAILLAVVVLYNLSLMNFKERIRDIATLKVLGFSKYEISFSLLTESLVLTFIGVLCGFILGYPFLQLVLNTNIVELVEYMVFIHPISFVYSFILTFIVAFVVNLILVQKTRKIKMIESLKSVE